MPPLTLRLKLDRRECVYGESVAFEIEIENASAVPVRIPELDPVNQAVSLELQSGADSRTATQRSAARREGRRLLTLEEPATVLLNPGRKLSLRGDLLEWFGPIDAGGHNILAVLTDERFAEPSAPVSLLVRPAAPLALVAVRGGQQLHTAPRTTAWVHRNGASAMLFYQLLSPSLPRRVVRAIAVCDVADARELHVAALPRPETPCGHVLWRDNRDRFFFCAIDLASGRAKPPTQIKAPLRGTVLASPLSLPDGGVSFVMTDERQEKIAIVRADVSGGVRSSLLTPGAGESLGAYACLWEFDEALRFIWCAAGGVEIRETALPLDQIGSAMVTRRIADATEPPLWIEARLDLDASFRNQPYLREQLEAGNPEPDTDAALPPPLILWIVTSRPEQLVCSRIDTADPRPPEPRVMAAPGVRSLRIMHAVPDADDELTMLVADDATKLFFAATTERQLVALSDRAGVDIRASQQPTLFAAAERTIAPWVYLRFIGQKQIECARLSPLDEMDPMER